jgi:hypothetical protein
VARAGAQAIPIPPYLSAGHQFLITGGGSWRSAAMVSPS